MNDLAMLDVVERYLRGEMLPEEKVYFENLRKSNPAVDQMVVEHNLFIHQLQQYGEMKDFKSQLHEIHGNLVETGEIREEQPVKVVTLWKKYKRVIGIAASIAGLVALTISGLVSSFTPKVDHELTLLRNAIDNTDQKINVVKNQLNSTPRGVEEPFTYGGTGFLVDAKGYIVTNAHIVKGATRVAVQNEIGEFMVKIIHVDPQSDIAYLKIEDTAFHFPWTIPYGISKSGTELGEELFTLGYPRGDAIVYGKGYTSAKTGFHGDTLDFQIAVPANPGNSGTPVLNKDGEVVGIMRASQEHAQSVAFAIKSKNIYTSLDALKADSALIKNDSSIARVHLPQSTALKGVDRIQQLKRIQECIFIVKAN